MKIEKRISWKASLNRGLRSDSEDARILEPPFCHNALLFMRVSLGRVREEQVENTWSVRYAPLATAARRAPYAIYLKYSLGNKQNQGRTKSSRGHLIARNRIHYKDFTMNDYMNKITTGIIPWSWSLLRSSDMVFHARFPRRLGRPYTTSMTLLSDMVSLKLLCSSTVDDEWIDAWPFAPWL
jgi:hypothetical protein